MAERGKVTAGIVRYLRKNIQDGAWRPGDRIPSENELCAALGVSRVSVRSALSQMTALGARFLNISSVRKRGISGSIGT